MGARLAVLAFGLLAFLPVGSTLAESQVARPDQAIEIVPLMPNASEVNDLALTPDGKFLISQGLMGSARDGRPRLWEVATGRLLRIFDGIEDRRWDFQAWGSMAISPIDPHVAVAVEGGIEIWDITSARRLRFLPAPKFNPAAVTYTPDGKFVVCGAEGRIGIFDLATGKFVRSFAAHKGLVTFVAVTPDRQLIVSGGDDGIINVWRWQGGTRVRTVKAHENPIETLRLLPDGKRALSASTDETKALKLWDLQSGRLVRAFDDSNILRATITPDGRKAITASMGRKLNVWDIATGKKLRMIGVDYEHPREDFVVFPDSRVLAQSSIYNVIQIIDLETGETVREIAPPGMVPSAFKLTPDGSQIAWASEGKRLTMFDTHTAQPVRRLEDAPDELRTIAFTPDGARLLGVGGGIPFTVWDVQSGQIARSFGGKQFNVRSIEVSPDGRHFISHGDELALWSLQDGRKVTVFGDNISATFGAEGDLLLNRPRVAGTNPDGSWERWTLKGREPVRVNTGIGELAFLKDGEAYVVLGSLCDGARLIKWRPATGFAKPIYSMELPCHNGIHFSADGRYAVLSSIWGYLYLVDLVAGRMARQFEGHGNEIEAVDMTRDGRYILTVATDGLKIWSPDTDKPLVTMLAIDERRWLTISPTGFFAGTRGGSELASIVRGLDVTSPEQMYQSLFAPDLIRERLAGDPDGEFKAAADVLNLRTVLDSGRVPQVALVSPAAGTTTGDEVVTAQARIADLGGGVGRIEWRVNGVTAAVTNVGTGGGAEHVISQALALEPGDNTVELVAYNGRNRLASLPVSTTVRWTPPANQPRPKLYVIAVGIDRYEDAVFRRLSLAVADAKAFGAAMKAAGAGLYADVDVTYVLDADATAAGLERAITDVGARMHPRDAFIFFAAAHGKSENGRFHLIPQNYRSAPGRPWTDGTIGQERLQDWFANRIRARRSVILLDTCESGALVAGRGSGVDAANSEAALGRLNEATGRPVLTAAAADQVALEGYKGHGVFTYALLDALRNGDANNNGQIELSEMAAHIQTLAPRLSRELSTGGTRSNRTRGFQPADDRPFASRQAGFGQKPKTGSQGEDFPLVRRLAVPSGSVP